MIRYLAFALVLLGILISLRILIPSFGKSIAQGISKVGGSSQLGDCSTEPNCQGSESTRSDQKTDRFEVSQSADQAIKTLAGIVSAISGTAIVEQTERYLHATFTTSLMGFVDDVEFLLSDDQKTVQVRSASRLGKNDLGANAARITLLRAASNGNL